MTSTYARAINASQEFPTAKVIAINRWVPPKVLNDSPANEVAGHSTTAGVNQPDILDHAFLVFHGCLRDYMMDKYGVMADSEAFDLHAAIVPCITMLPESDGTTTPDATSI